MFTLEILENVAKHQEENKIIDAYHLPNIVTLHILENILYLSTYIATKHLYS